MPDFDPSKIAIVLLFLAILVAVQIVIKRSKFLKFKIDKSNHSAIKVINTVVVSKFASATVLECSGTSFLVVSNRNGAPSVVELPKERENKLFTKTDLELEGT
jgi:hypothetical protein